VSKGSGHVWFNATEPRRVAPAPLRLPISLLLGMVAALLTYVIAVKRPGDSDIMLFYTAATAILHGKNAYAVLPGLTYPLPGLLLITPFALMPAGAASALFMLVGTTAFAWALMEHGYGPLIGFFSPGMLFAAQVGQWSPLFAGAVAVAPLGVYLIAKPHVGLATFLARPTWWAVGGAMVSIAIAFAAQPTWLHDWRASMALAGVRVGTGQGAFQYNAPVALTGGVLVLLALSKWRRPEARLLVALACVPQSLLLYEIVPLALVPRGWKQAATYLVLSHAVWRILRAQNPWPGRVEYTNASGTLITLAIFLPLTAMVLKRPNEGSLPAWLETRIASWPAWLRGRSSVPDFQATVVEQEA